MLEGWEVKAIRADRVESRVPASPVRMANLAAWHAITPLSGSIDAHVHPDPVRQ